MMKRILATLGVLALIGVAVYLALAAAADGVHDGRSLLALIAGALAAALWWRSEREHTDAVLTDPGDPE